MGGEEIFETDLIKNDSRDLTWENMKMVDIILFDLIFSILIYSSF